MHVSKVHLSEPATIRWRGKPVKTGIFKVPVAHPVRLLKTGVEGDYVADRIHHGGPDMAFYTYPLEHYDYWKKRYPDKSWQTGMFGENLTTFGLLESDVRVGTLFRLGNGLVKAIQPRQPCYKLGVKFGSQEILPAFIQSGFPGIYFRVLEPCIVEEKTSFELVEEPYDGPTIAEVFRLIYEKSPDQSLIRKVEESKDLPDNLKEHIAARQRRS